MADPIPTSKAELDARFTELYRAHLRDVYSYSYYRVGNHHDAEDLTEQTFLQAYRHFERALRESDGRPLRPWLIRIAHNLAANFYRDRARKPESAIEDAGMISAPHTTESLVEGREELKAILAGVQQLPDDRREALIMRFALGMDNREIARALGRTDGATKVLLHRAIRQLEGIVAEQAERGATGMTTNVEALLREALTPVDPPADLHLRLEGTLVNITGLAQEELESWELSAMRDPRNWVRPAAAVAGHGHRRQRAGRIASSFAPPRPQAGVGGTAGSRRADLRGHRGGDPPDPPRPLSTHLRPATTGQCLMPARC